MQFIRKFILLSLCCYKKVLSPYLPPACRFLPTCSEYSYLAIHKYGVLRGTFLSLRRLIRCHPFHTGGHDPLI